MSNIDVLSDGIKQIYETREDDAFSNARLFHALLDDIVPTLTNERKIFRSVIDDSLLKELFLMFNADKSNKQFESIRIKKKIEDNNGLSEKWSSFIVESFIGATGVKVDIFPDKFSNGILEIQEREKTNDTSINKSYTLNDDTDYEGDFSKGKPHGNGKKIYSNGDSYEGEFVNGVVSGKGRYVWSSGNIYQGDFVNGKFHGHGKLIWKDGDIYEGEYVNDKRTGKGKLTFASGDIYVGDFVDGSFHGYGKYFFANGDIYEGEYINDKRSGIGKSIWKDGNIYEGEYIDDKRTGKGKFIFKSGNIYEGDFVDGDFNGVGKYTWTDGDVYEGEFINDKRTGKGKFIWANGDIYKGDFINGIITGNGTMTKNGVRQSGYFENGILKSSNEQSIVSVNNLESEYLTKKKLLLEKRDALTKELKSLGIFEVKKKSEIRNQILEIDLKLTLNITEDKLNYLEEVEKGINKKTNIMKVDDKFSIKGRGTVVVGKLLCEKLYSGDTVIVNDKTYTVAAIEMNKKILKFAEFGDYISILVRGLESRDTDKGDYIYKEMK